MVANLKKAKDLLSHFEVYKLLQILRVENGYEDALSKLASSRDSDLMKAIPVEKLSRPTIDESLPTMAMKIFESPRWMKEIIAYLSNQVLPSDKQEAQKLCSRKKFATIPKLPAQNLTPITSPWPFVKWEIDFIGPLPTGRGGVKFAVVAVDYFTKWCEAKPLAKITEENTWKFVWKNIICRFGILHSLVSDNGTQFTGKKFNSNCENLDIRRDFSTSYYPQANGQVEAMNKIIKHTLKRKLECAK
ncbi:Integrase catalytic domain-containing protein [Abeliophyllum distichum]|uniref:Integrase catalytic domain-containing protein n=1 Tax=Abeliophyllum distichum TaxID=126358 RepID=A0ABD1QH71_9LAMI